MICTNENNALSENIWWCKNPTCEEGIQNIQRRKGIGWDEDKIETKMGKG
jgi:hypothetical protein